MEKHPSAPDTPPLISSPDSTTPPPPNPSNGGIRELFHLAYPMVLSMISWTVMGFVDSAMVGRLGATELAAVGFSGIWLMIAFAMLHGTTMSLQTFVSQSDGAGEHERCGAWTWQSLYAVAPGTLVAIAGLALFLRPFLGQLGISPELESTAVEYVRPRLVGEFAWVATFAFMSFFRGVGDMRTPLYVGVAANLVNVVLDYGLIFGELGMPEWGIWGAGVATAASDWFALIVIFVAFRRRSVDERYHTGFVRPRLDEIRRLLRLGAPIGGQMLLGESSYAVFSIFIARMGDVEMAVSQALVILLSLTFMQAHGIGGAAATLVGRYVGARDEDGVLRSFHSALKLAAFVAVTVGLLFLLAPEPLLRLFTPDSQVIALGVPLVPLCAFLQFLDAALIITEGALRGAGDTRWPFFVRALFAWGFFVPLVYTLGIWLEGGLFGAWFAYVPYQISLSAVLIWRFRSGVWRNIRI